jgi:hypothetical protein
VLLALLLNVVPTFAAEAPQDPITLTVETLPLAAAAPACSGTFIAHDLDHFTSVPGGDQVRMFEANGGGVGINDLDNDGDLDVVLANHAGMNTILWNEGNLNFRTERLSHGESRAVTLVDVDGDGWQDMVFTRTRSAPTYWHNEGSGHFVQEFLNGVGVPLYAINWADLDHDGDLDLVGATYDASLLTDFGNDFLISGNGGVYYYENNDGYFRQHGLATRAQALALALVDINADGYLDIWVGNDFDVPDHLWYRAGDGWQAVNPLPPMSRSTMSLDVGDVDNDGQLEMFSTDMNPYEDGLQASAAWHPILDARLPRLEGDPQRDANVLQSLGSFTDSAAQAGVAASGWSWSGKFGDLDQDGWLDLYIVNGFIEVTTFAHLPNHELVEENQAFRNTGNGQFTPAPEWGLGSTRSGRGMSMADLDGDGDLDLVVNNLRGAAQLFENQLCTGHSLQVELVWADSGNRYALGTLLKLHTDYGVYMRDMRAASGYISSDAARVHFGIPAAAYVQRLEVHWSDGVVSTIPTPAQNALLRITRSS